MRVVRIAVLATITAIENFQSRKNRLKRFFLPRSHRGHGEEENVDAVALARVFRRNVTMLLETQLALSVPRALLAQSDTRCRPRA